jgi:hypothetical protein
MKTTLLLFLGALALLFTACGNLRQAPAVANTPAKTINLAENASSALIADNGLKIVLICNPNGPLACNINGTGTFILPNGSHVTYVTPNKNGDINLFVRYIEVGNKPRFRLLSFHTAPEQRVLEINIPLIENRAGSIDLASAK